MWTSVAPIDVESPAPSARSKHSATLVGEYVFLLGGRNGNLPTKDFWKYNLVTGKWTLLKPSGDKLPCLQEHSAVAYRDSIYVYGGEVGFSTATETPLWCYDINYNVWKKIRSKKGVATPKGRRGHTALVHGESMLIYGGYQDLRGSCCELWAFHFETESWHLLSTSPSKYNNSELVFPPPRHKHSAIIHNDAMYVYGGMTDLQERADFWKWDTRSKIWTLIKTKINPGALHSHAVCKLPSSMLLFGGEKCGHPISDLWKFNFSIELWEKLVINGPKPQPRSESIAFAVSELLLLHPPSPSATTLESKSVRVRARTCTSADRSGQRHSSYLPNNRVAPAEKTYVFQPSLANYTDGSLDLALQYAEEEPKAHRTTFLQEITKISHLNIAKLNGKCSYSVLTTESTESLLRQHASPPGYRPETPPRMVKSKSACAIKRRPNASRVGSPEDGLTHEPLSVPNFSLLALPTPALTPVEAAKLVYLDTDDENDLIGERQAEVRREESYSSHLAYADNPLYQHMINPTLPGEENVSSTSDYASIETMNRLSSSSNYSEKNQQQEESEQNKENRMRSLNDGPFGFCNPNYLGPDIKALMLDGNESEKKVMVHNSEEELLEMQEVNGIINRNTKVYFSRQHSGRVKDTVQQKAKSRALSASRAERRSEKKADFDRVLDPFVPLHVYVIGGKEQGQVTVFQRPISIWKLKLY